MSNEIPENHPEHRRFEPPVPEQGAEESEEQTLAELTYALNYLFLSLRERGMSDEQARETLRLRIDDSLSKIAREEASQSS
jgi:hypothetical protein